MAYDTLRSVTVMFGGVAGSNIFGDTWEWSGPSSIPGHALAFGTGCGSPLLLLAPNANATPRIGTTAQALMTNVPSPVVFVVAGWTNTNIGPFTLPMPLDGWGMTGCKLWHSAEVLGQPVTITSPTTATYSLAIPFWASLIGLRIYLQGYGIAPGMNPAEVIFSNGVDWLVGF